MNIVNHHPLNKSNSAPSFQQRLYVLTPKEVSGVLKSVRGTSPMTALQTIQLTQLVQQEQAAQRLVRIAMRPSSKKSRPIGFTTSR